MCDCDRALELLSARLDGALGDAERVELEEHLASCEACRVAADELAAIHGVMPELLEEVPEGFHGRLMEKIAAEKVVSFPVKKRPAAWKSWASLAAVFAVILLGGNAVTHLGAKSVTSMPSSVAPAAAGYSAGESAAAPQDDSPENGSADTGNGVPEAASNDAGQYEVEPEAAQQKNQITAADAAPTPAPKATTAPASAPPEGLTGGAVPRVFTGVNMGLAPETAGAMAAEAEYPGAEVTALTDANGNYSGWKAVLADGVSVEVSYLGLSPNGAYFEFSLADKDTGEERNRFAVKADGSAVEHLNKLGQEAYNALTGAEQ